MKKLAVILLFAMLFIFPVSANEDTYQHGIEITEAERINDALPKEVLDWLQENNIDFSDENWVNNFNAGSVFSYIWFFLRSGMKTPLKTGGAIIGVILISTAFPALSNGEKNFDAAKYSCVLATAITVAIPVWKAVSAAVAAIKGCGTFMLSFVPVFAVIVSVSGGVASAVSMSTVLLMVSELLVSICAFSVLPLMGGYLAMSLCSSVSPLVNTAGITEGIKKVGLWIMSLVSTVFLGILSVQTAVNSAADSVALRTTKFIIGTSVPVAGAALSEATAVLSSSLSLLRTSVGIYGVVALCAIILPIVISLMLWRVMLMISTVVSEAFSQPLITKLLKSVDMMLSLLVGVCLLVGAVFIISLSVVVGAVKGI